MKRYNGQALVKFDDPDSGNAAAGVSVTVRLVSDDTLAPIFSDDQGTPLTNPTATDQNGRYGFFADAFVNIIIAEGQADEVTLADVDLTGPFALEARNIATGTGLTGGGDLSQDRALEVDGTVLIQGDGRAVETSGNQTITGVKTFASLPEASNAPADPDQLANKAYVDSTGGSLTTIYTGPSASSTITLTPGDYLDKELIIVTTNGTNRYTSYMVCSGGSTEFRATRGSDTTLILNRTSGELTSTNGGDRYQIAKVRNF